tara:strand:+ start:728 stop:976 length:249 start_codon:yes stop_codon:yes gene_type:complete
MSRVYFFLFELDRTGGPELLVPDGNGSVRSVASQTRNEEWVILTGHRFFCGRQCSAQGRPAAWGSEDITQTRIRNEDWKTRI